MLTAQLDCNPLYPTAWQNDRNITNQKRGGGRSRRGGGGGAGGRSRSLSSAPRPSPSSRPGEGRAGRKAPFAAVTAPPEDRRGGRSCYFRKGSRRRGLPAAAAEPLWTRRGDVSGPVAAEPTRPLFPRRTSGPRGRESARSLPCDEAPGRPAPRNDFLARSGWWRPT